MDTFPPRRVPRGWDLYVFRASTSVMQRFDYLHGPAASPGRAKGRTLSQWYAGLGHRFVPLLDGVAQACGLEPGTGYDIVRHDKGRPYLAVFTEPLVAALAEEDMREFLASIQEHPAFTDFARRRSEAWARALPYELDSELLGTARLARKHGDLMYAWLGPGPAAVASPRLRARAEHLLHRPSDGR